MHHIHLQGKPPVLKSGSRPPLSRPDNLFRHSARDASDRSVLQYVPAVPPDTVSDLAASTTRSRYAFSFFHILPASAFRAYLRWLPQCRFCRYHEVPTPVRSGLSLPMSSGIDPFSASAFSKESSSVFRYSGHAVRSLRFGILRYDSGY